ncbi:ABC transporter permease [Aestuariimicrobium ganziense]|uniref:ABC transporter permease n=1 Tax=Aestuariimicrobium ganziense TaxID=2773677 RepID=UPI001943A45E|nr:hypothetical protein [Aestuariimicrobium ganziense]
MSQTTGTAALLRAALRRDRVLLPVWVLALSSMVAVSAAAMEGLYASAADRVIASRVINTSPALVALYGPILNEDSMGELAMSKMTVMYAVFVMGMALVIVRRHTRTEEESGRAELVGTTLVGRAAPLRAALLEGVLASVLVGALGALGNIAFGLEVPGSVAFGLSWVGAGLVGTGIAAVCCQLSASTRTCGGIAMAVIAALFLLRAVGDIGPDALGWLSPLGWGTRLDAWGQTRWWVLVLYLVLAVGLVVLAHVLFGRRDLGSGLLAERAGSPDGRVGTIPGLVWRLNRGLSLWWVVATVLWGALFGSVAPHIGGLFDSPGGREVLEALGGRGKVEEVMLAALMAIMAAFLTGYALQVVVHAGHEETDGRTPAVHAAHGSRAQLFWSVVALAMGGLVVLAVCYAVGSSLGYGSQSGGVWSALREQVPAALVHLPAMWVVAAVAVLAGAVRARWAWLGWVVLGVVVTIGELGPVLKLPGWVVKISPYQHVAAVPVEPVSWPSEAGLVAVAAVLLGGAGWRYRARDLGGLPASRFPRAAGTRLRG